MNYSVSKKETELINEPESTNESAPVHSRAPKLIVLSQRVDEDNPYHERRDALDQRWARLLAQCHLLAVPIGNYPPMLPAILNRLSPDGILLTGGVSPALYGGQAPERDQTDEALIAYAQQHNLPLLGVCRGMQSIALYFGSTLKPITGHRAQRHTITAAAALKQEVNSYHTLAIDQLGPDLVPLAHALDGSIEAIRHQSLPIYGLMWHPEREEPLHQSDIQYIRQCFQAAP